MIRDLFATGYANGVHIYTLNREVAPTSILKKLGKTIMIMITTTKFVIGSIPSFEMFPLMSQKIKPKHFFFL